VIVDDLHVERVAVSPAKADPPLIVHADAVLPRAITREALQAVPWRNAKVLQ